MLKKFKTAVGGGCDRQISKIGSRFDRGKANLCGLICGAVEFGVFYPLSSVN